MARTQKLNEGWKFRRADEEGWLPAAVPGCVHTDLLKNGKIEDPFYGTNEHRLQWIDKKDWLYETTFDASDVFGESSIDLVFDGLDTYCDVYLNGALILKADNMFRQWRVQVKQHLKETNNSLQLLFRSPIHEDLPKLEQLDYKLPAPNDQSELGGLGDKQVSVFARKAPYHYGWDWGPRFVTSGIWREVRLEAWTGLHLNDLYIRQDEISTEKAVLTAIAEVEADAEYRGLFTVSTDGGRWDAEVDLKPGVQSIELKLTIKEPKLWWSRGLGEQHLYTFDAVLQAKGGLLSHRLSVRTGLRSARLVREEDAFGTSFYIELNGVPVFAKGANHIPGDSFITEMTRERYRHEIESAALANMNMLRIWGGGIYEQHDFYELCDEYGIMVWQDFMFACSMYPGDAAFLNNVREEAEYNVKRLRNYPSVVLWCGNNEIDSAWSQFNDNMGWGWRKEFSQEQQETLWHDYEQIFHVILPQAVDKMLQGIPYWPSSPMQDVTGDINQHAHNQSTKGDIHYWGVWHNKEPFENYNVNVGRFMSEYGFQSFPEYKTVTAYAEEGDMQLESEVMMAHQKNGRGNLLIKSYMDNYMKEPKDFPSFLYMSQVLQAEAMKMAIHAHRRRKGFCMGTLYWQINDCWPVASWAGMDYNGRWKATHYYAKRSFSDVLVSIDGTSEDSLAIYAVSDLLQPIQGSLQVTLTDFDGKLLHESSYPVSASANSSTELLVLGKEELLQGADTKAVVVSAVLFVEEKRVHEEQYYFVPFKDMALRKANIEITEVEGSGGTMWRIESDTLAKDVWLSAEAEGEFSNNYFDLLPGKPEVVAFLSRTGQGLLPGQPGGLKASSMADFTL